jgi:hypothetical protein
MHRPFDAYVRDKRTYRHRGTEPAARRRQWSMWTITVNPNITAGDSQEERFLHALLAATARRIFTNPRLIRSFMESVDVGPGSRLGETISNPAQFPMREYRDFRGDQFDGSHVFQHSFRTTLETGHHFNRPHIMIDYAVLHDSAFKIDTRVFGVPIEEQDGRLSFPYLFGHKFNEMLRESGLLRTHPEWEREIRDGHAGVYVHVQAHRLFINDEYRVKEQRGGQQGRWSNPSWQQQRFIDPATGRPTGAQERRADQELVPIPPAPGRAPDDVPPERTQAQQQLVMRRTMIRRAMERARPR